MSVYTYIGCTDCKESIFIGRLCRTEEGRVLTTITTKLSILSDFLLKHRNHNLIFDNEKNRIIDDMEDFEKDSE